MRVLLYLWNHISLFFKKRKLVIIGGKVIYWFGSFYFEKWELHTKCGIIQFVSFKLDKSSDQLRTTVEIERYLFVRLDLYIWFCGLLSCIFQLQIFFFSFSFCDMILRLNFFFTCTCEIGQLWPFTLFMISFGCLGLEAKFSFKTLVTQAKEVRIEWFNCPRIVTK